MDQWNDMVCQELQRKKLKEKVAFSPDGARVLSHTLKLLIPG